MTILLVAILAVMVIGMAFFFREIKNAPTIDDKEPFLRGDYDPKKDPTLAK